MALILTREVLSKLAPRPKDTAKAKIWDGYVEALTSRRGAELLVKFGITTHLRMAHILAQWCHECSGFTLVWESGAYSAKRIVQIFGVGHHSAKVTAAEASRLAYNGPALFDRVYGLGNSSKAKELGNTKVGDGWRFRGCGIVQLTGRGAHEGYAEEIGCAIGDLEKPVNAIHGALLEWQEKKCNAAADKDDVVAVTKKVNGGRNGLEERNLYLHKAKRLLDAMDTNAPLPVDPVEDAPVVEPVDMTKTPVAALTLVSRKASMLWRAKTALHAVWASLTLGSLMEWLGYAQSILDQVGQFLSDHALAVAVTASIVGVLVIKYVLSLMAEDVDAGRSIPSGEAV